MQAIRATVTVSPQTIEQLRAEGNHVFVQREAQLIEVEACEVEMKMKESTIMNNIYWDSPGFYIRSDNNEFVRHDQTNTVPSDVELIPLPPRVLSEYYGWSQGIEFYAIESEAHFDLFTRDYLGYNDRNPFCDYPDTDPLPYQEAINKLPNNILDTASIQAYIEYAEKRGWESVEDDWMEDIHNRTRFHINQWEEYIEKGEDLKNKYIIQWV